MPQRKKRSTSSAHGRSIENKEIVAGIRRTVRRDRKKPRGQVIVERTIANPKSKK